MNEKLTNRQLKLRLMVMLMMFGFALSLSSAVLGTIYCRLDLESPTGGVGTSVELTAIIDSIRTATGSPVLAASPCMQEYQSWRLHSTAGRPLANILPEAGDHCTGSPCYRDYYTHSSPFDLDRELVATACYFFVSDSLDSADAFLRSDHAFFVDCYRPGNLEISMTEEYRTTTLDIWEVVSDTVTLTITGPAMDCPPLQAPQCGEVYDITPIEAKGIWQHVMLHDGYQYRVNTSPSPPGSGFDIDTNYIELDGLVSETSYFLHVRAWCNCETAGRSYSPWTSIPFNTLPQPITTIKTSPEDLMFIADGDTFYTTTNFEWPYVGSGGPCYWIEAVSPQAYPPDGAIYYFREWSDGGGFGHCHSVGATNVTITCFYDSLKAGFAVQDAPPLSVCASSVIDVSVTMINSGSVEWTTWDNLYLWSQNPPMNDIWGLSEVEFEGSAVLPGETHTFEFTVTAPSAPGDYIFQWQMGKAGISFFGEQTDPVTVTVQEKPLATASNGGPYCQNEVAELSGGPDGMTSYTWSGPGGFTSTEQSPILGTAGTSMTGSYRLIVQNSHGCLDTATTYLTVNPKPSASASNTGPYCGGQTIELTANPAGMATYEWTGPRGFFADTRIASIPTADTVSAGTYTVIVTSSAGCVDTAETDVTVYYKPEITANTNAPVCEGSVLELRAEPPGLDSYFWHAPDGTIIPGRVIFRNPVTPEMAGLYHVIGTSSDGCADTSYIMAIIDTVIKTMEIDSITADSTFIFAGSITELHCFVSGAIGDVSYHWEPVGMILEPDTSDPMVAPPVTTTFEVTVRDSQECGVYEISDTILIRVMSSFECLITIDTITHDARICIGDSVDLYARASLAVGTADYRWSPNYNISSISSQTPVVYPETTTIYTVIAEDDSGCVDTAEVEIFVSDIQFAFSPDSPVICMGDEIELTALTHGGFPPYDIAWLPAGSITEIDSYRVFAHPETTTVFTVIAVDSLGCVGMEYITVEVDTPITTLTIDLSADDSSLILGESTRLYAHAFSAGGTVTYSWSPAGYFDAPGSPTPWATPLASGWLYVEVTDHQDHCEYSIFDSIFIDVEDTSSCPLEIVSITPDTHICRGSELAMDVSVSGATGSVEYSWTPTSSLSDPASPNPLATPNHTTFYWVFVNDDSCADSARVIVYVDTVLTTMRILSASATFDTIDLGDSTLLFASITGEAGELGIRWQPESSLATPDSIKTWAFPTEPTTYIITASDTQECGVYSVAESVHVHVNTWFGCSLSVNAYGADSICPGGFASLDLLASGGAGTSAFEWTPHDGLSNPFIANPTASPTATTTYTVTAEDDSGCVARDSVTVWVKTLDSSALPDLHICNTDTILLDLSYHAGVEPITWNWSPLIFLSDAGVSSPLCWPDSSIEYTVVALDAEGCADTIAISISVDSLSTSMDVSMSPDTTIHYGGTANLRAAISGEIGSTGWFWTPSSWLDDPSSLTPNATPPVRTVYHFAAYDSQFCGVYSVSDSVIVDVVFHSDCSLNVSSAFAETTVCRGASISLETSVIGAFGDVSYEWRPSTYLDFTDIPNPTAVSIDTSMTYTVISTDDSCSDSANVIVHVPRLFSLLDNDITVCINDTAEMWGEMFRGSGDIAYNWYPTDFLSNPDSNFTLVFPETTTTYTLTAIDEAGCSDSITVHVIVDTVLNHMTLSIFASPVLLNFGDSTLLNCVVTDAIGDVSLEWTSGTGTVSSPSSASTWAFPETTGWFYVDVADSQDCGIYTLSDSVLIEVILSPCSLTVYIDSPDSICRGDSVRLNASAVNTNGNTTWLWRPSEGLNNPVTSNPWASPQTSTFYWAIAEDSLGCRDSNGVTVIVRETPEAFAMAIEETLYIDEILELRGFSIDSTFSYGWEGPNDFISESRIVIIDSLTLDHGGWYYLTVVNSSGCYDIDSVYIEILTYPRMPEIDINPSILLLDIYEGDISDSATVSIANTGDSILFVSAVYSAINLPEFSIDDISPIEIEPGFSENLEVTFSASITGTYVDTLIVESNDPHETVSKIVIRGRVHPPEDPSISAFPDVLDFGTVQLDSCTIDSIYFNNSGGGSLVIYSVIPQVPNIFHLRPPLPDTLTMGAGAYYVFEFCPVVTGSLHSWIHTESNDPEAGIFQLLALGLCVKHSGYAVTTEVITPNADGMNDEIEFIIPDEITSWNVEIYNSRGSLVTSGQIRRWNALRDGAPLPIGTYYYRITSQDETRLSGAISIIY